MREKKGDAIMGEKWVVHPYIPNSVPDIREEMLHEIGVDDVEELFVEIPTHLRFKGRLDIPEPIRSEAGIQRHVEQILAKNKTCKEYLNFLGAGCWQHHVPAVVDEIVGRSEFVTAYCGANYSDHGKYQTRFEFNSMMGELLNMDAVANPIYDYFAADGLQNHRPQPGADAQNDRARTAGTDQKSPSTGGHVDPYRHRSGGLRCRYRTVEPGGSSQQNLRRDGGSIH
jgi:hypothetical protein